MSETQETIIAEMRDLAANRDWHNHTGQSNRERVFNLADRLEAALKRERGDCAKLRETVIGLRDRISMFYKSEWIPYDEWEGANDDADAALTAPPRNCDVGTAEEQEKRYNEWLNADAGRAVFGLDPLEWAQMPYEEGEAK